MYAVRLAATGQERNFRCDSFRDAAVEGLSTRLAEGMPRVKLYRTNQWPNTAPDTSARLRVNTVKPQIMALTTIADGQNDLVAS